MNKNQIDSTQLATLVFTVLSGEKLLQVPSLLAKDVGHDSWIVVLCLFVADAICMCLCLWAVKINLKHRLTFGTILQKTVTRVGKFVVLALFFALFVCRILTLCVSSYKMFATTFDISTDWTLFVALVAIVCYVAICLGFNAIARTSQLLFPLMFLSVLTLLVFPATQVPVSQLLPIGEAGVENIAQSAFSRSFWFGDYVVVYFLMEHVQPKNNKLFAPVLTTFAVGALLVVAVNVIFVCLFGSLAQNSAIAISKISLFSVADSSNGRWDWLTLSVWLMSVLVKVVVFFFCAYRCVQEALGLHFSKTSLPVVLAIALPLLVPLFVSSEDVVAKFVTWCTIPFAIVLYVLPFAMPLLATIANKKEANL